MRPKTSLPASTRPSLEALETRCLLSSGGLQRIGSLVLNPGQHTLYLAVGDTPDGYAYFATTRAGPAQIIKVKLGVGDAMPTEVGSLTLPTGVDHVLGGALDLANGYGYFTATGEIVKVALGTGSAAPTLVSTMPLSSGEFMTDAIIDPAAGYVYFSGSSSGGEEIIKAALGTGAAAPTRVATLNLGGSTFVWRAMIDTAHGYAYYPTTDGTGRFFKVALGVGSAAPTLVATLTLPAGVGTIGGADIDTSAGYAYLANVGTYGDGKPGQFLKVALGAGAAAPTLVGSISLPEEHFSTVLVDPVGGFAYLGNDITWPASNVVKISLGAGSALPTEVGSIQLQVGAIPPTPPAGSAPQPQSGDMYIRCGVLDAQAGYAYFGTDGDPGLVIKVRLASASPPANLVPAARAITHSAEYYQLFVTNAYQHYLGRSPDAGGLSAWVNALLQGMTEERVEAALLTSTEYVQNHGGLGATWVAGLYHDVLGRTASSAEITGWTNAMTGGTTAAAIASAFVSSAEREANRVRNAYTTYLGRTATSSEISGWTSLLVSGMTNEDLIADFVGSAEYFYNPLKGAGSTVGWINSAYHDILQRTPSSAEVSAWQTFLGG
jgi:hypothetical protein